MHIVIMGAGETGYSLAYKLIQEDKEVALIEVDAKKARKADDNLDCLVINDNGNNPAVLKKAGITKAEYFVALTESDELNMIVCALVSAEHSDVKTIARIGNHHYSQSGLIANSYFKIDYIITPKIAVSRIIIDTINHGARGEVMTFENSQFQIRDLAIGRKSPFIGKSMAELKPDMPDDFLAIAILRDDQYIIPKGGTIIKERDFVYILSTEEGFEQIFSSAGSHRKPLSNVLMVGCGETGSLVADYLCGSEDNHSNIIDKVIRFLRRKPSYNVHIVDADYDRCQVLAERYPHALITNANISDEGFLEEEDLAGYDLMINTTDAQELNIVAGAYGKKLGIERVISVVKKNGYRTISKYLDLDVTISRKNSVVNNIMRIVRKDSLHNIHVIADSTLETIEFSIDGKSKAAGRMVKDLKMDEDSLILFISRSGESLIPKGNDTILAGDHLVFMTSKKAVKKIEREIVNS